MSDVKYGIVALSHSIVGLRWLPMCITLHLSGWKLSNHLSDQSCICDMSFCRQSGLPGMSDLTYTFVSSANSLTPHKV